MAPGPEQGFSALEYHVLLAVAAEPLHGYAIRDAVEDESRGALSPRAGSLYRVIGRLVDAELLREADVDEDEAHPGRPRRYYELTGAGRGALTAEARRLELVAATALDRLELGRP